MYNLEPMTPPREKRGPYIKEFGHKVRRVVLRLAIDEDTEFRACAAETGMTLSEWLRSGGWMMVERQRRNRQPRRR